MPNPPKLPTKEKYGPHNKPEVRMTMSMTSKKLKRVPTKPIRVSTKPISLKSHDIKTPKIEISGTNVGGGKFTRSANRSLSTSPTHESFHGIKTTSNKDKKINYNLESANTKGMQAPQPLPKIGMKGKTEPDRTSTEGNVYGR